MTLQESNSEPAAVAEPERKTRSDHLTQHNEKCERIMHLFMPWKTSRWFNQKSAA